MRDGYGRDINYMRISLTDQCNLQCRYCVPEKTAKLPPGEILQDEQILAVCRAAVSLGIRYFKITGGEPLIREGCARLAGEIKRIPGVRRVTMTTNGVLLGKYLRQLEESGLDCVNVSLDTLNADRFREITGRDCHGHVMENIRRTALSGIPVKINCVLQRGTNEDEWDELARLAFQMPVDVRFIEMMPIGAGRFCEGISNEALFALLREKYPGMRPDPEKHGSGPAVYWRIPGFLGSIGFISAIHGKYCDRCNRLRLTAGGRMKPCLCYEDSVDLRQAFHERLAEDELADRLREYIREAVLQKPREHCFESPDGITERQCMSGIGG